MIRMDEFNKIRKAFFSESKSRYQIAKEFKRSWETIDRIVKTSREDVGTRGKRPCRSPIVATEDVLENIEQYLQEEINKGVKRKQRYKAKKIFNDLKERGIYKGSLRTMQDLIKGLREKHNQTKQRTFLPLEFSLGSCLQIDHGEVDCVIQGKRCKGYLFTSSVPGAGLRHCTLFPTKTKEAWGEFHERTFRFFGGVFESVMYDNDTVLVKKVMGHERRRTDFSHELEEHYGFESRFCNVASGQEKGSVENAVGYCRRNFLPGCPGYASWDEANYHLEESCLKDLQGQHFKTHEPLQLLFDKLQKQLRPIPPLKNWRRWTTCRVSSSQLITTDGHQYSVPERFVGAYLNISQTVFQVEIFKDSELIVTHPRQYQGQDSFCLDHYLNQLKCKPGALWDCRVVQQHSFDSLFLEVYQRLTERHATRDANVQFVQILLLGRRYSQKHLLGALEKALTYGSIEHVVIENILRQFESPKVEYDEEALKDRLPFIQYPQLCFDLSPYTQLTMEAGQ